MRLLITGILFTGAPFLDCLRGGPIACTAVYAYGLTVHLKDASTGAKITNATLTLVDGDYSEVMTTFEAGTYIGAGERGGRYTLTAAAPGYETRVIDNILITEDICHVIGISLDVELTPASS